MRLKNLAMLMVLMWCGCVEQSPLDPNKPLPVDLEEVLVGTPPRRCSLETLSPRATDLQLHVIDVGQGDALLLRTPDDGVDGNGVAEGLTILIDAGDNGLLGSTDGAEVVSEWLNRFNITKIDYAVVTHAHTDHFGGFIKLFERYDIINVLEPGYSAGGLKYAQFLEAAAAEVAEHNGVLSQPGGATACSGEVEQLSIWGDELGVRLMQASGDGALLGSVENSQINNTSLVLHLDYKGIGVLLMGDAEKEVETCLSESGLDLSAHILKAGHHGSSTSSTQALLERVWSEAIPKEKRFAAVSSGRKDFNGTQLPSVLTMFRLRTLALSSHVFSTEFNDDDKNEEDASGDDNIVFVVREEGEIEACLVR